MNKTLLHPKYTIIELLGKGSYASVYLGRAVSDNNKLVAVKIFDRDKKCRNVKDEISILK